MTKFKRAAALIGAVMVLVCCFSFPVMASDQAPSFTDSMLYSYWNIQTINVVYKDGSVAVFDFPRFLLYDGVTKQVSQYLVSDTGDLLTLNIILYGDRDSAQPSTSFDHVLNFDKPIASATFNFGDTFIPYDYLSGVTPPPSVALTYFNGSSLVNLPGSFSKITGTYYNFHPTYFYDDDGRIVGRTPQRTYGTFDNSYVTTVGRDIAPDPFNFIHNYPGEDRIVYFPNCTSFVSFAGDGVTKFALLLDYCEYEVSSTNQSEYDASKFMFKYFPAYENVDWGDISDIPAFLTTVFGGFFNFEFVPGLSLGALFLGLLGLLGVIAFLRWFAGG